METCVRDRQILPLNDRWASAPQTAFEAQAVALRHCELGKIRLEMGRFAEALGLFEQALTLQPHDVESWCGRAEALACLGRSDEALHSIEQAQELAGFANTRLWVQKAGLLVLLNRPEAALNCCNRALWLSPSHAQAWLFRGVALQGLGRFQAACRSYRRVTQPTASPLTSFVNQL